MFKKNFIAGIILAGIIAITGSGAVFAVKDDASPQNKPETSSKVPINPELMHVRVKAALDNLVKEGTITQSQEDAVLKAMAARKEKYALKDKEKAPDGQKPHKDGKCKHHSRKHGVLKDLVKDGTITQEQADAIRKALKSVRESMKKPE